MFKQLAAKKARANRSHSKQRDERQWRCGLRKLLAALTVRGLSSLIAGARCARGRVLIAARAGSCAAILVAAARRTARPYWLRIRRAAAGGTAARAR